MSRREMNELLSGVVGVVDANRYEQLTLWQENQRRERPVTWKENGAGFMEIVGHLADMPVCLSLFAAEIDGQKLLFIEATSQVVDHRMINQWLTTTLPKSAFRDSGYVNRTDAMNFHNVFRPGGGAHQGGA